MGKIWEALRRGWKACRRTVSLAVPFHLTCACGRVVEGSRQGKHQARRCPQCNQPLFVLPYVRYAAGTGTQSLTDGSPVPPGTPPPPRLSWRGPRIAALVTLSAVIAGYAVLFTAWRAPEITPAPPGDLLSPSACVREGCRLLAEGDPRAALVRFDEANRRPESLTRMERRQLDQGRRQAALITNLLREPLQAILEEGKGERREEEWLARFEQNFRGKAVIFDDWVQRDGPGSYALVVYEVWAGQGATREKARVELGDLQLIRGLKIDQPRRLLFGARLVSCQREALGAWVFRFEPDSGVLLTEEGAVACGLVPLDDPLRQVLREQESWINEQP
jgi:hypothetical protein